MGFLAAIGAKILEKILVWGGKFLYETISDFVEKHKQEKANKENTKKHNEDIVNNAPKEKKGESGRRLINGE